MTLETLASRMQLSPAEAVALPATINAAAKAVNKTREQLLAECGRNAALTNYLAGVCRKVA